MVDYAESDPSQAALGLGSTAPKGPMGAPNLASPQTDPVSQPSQLGLGNQAPNYDTLRSNAVNAYLGSGGTQANVDAYFKNNPTQDYGRLASDASQWWTNEHPGDAANQQVGNYFGVTPPASGQNYKFAPPGPVTPTNTPQTFMPGQGLNWQGTSPGDLYKQFQSMDPGLQQQYINYYNGLDPLGQGQMRAAFGQPDPGGISGYPSYTGPGGNVGTSGYPNYTGPGGDVGTTGYPNYTGPGGNVGTSSQPNPSGTSGYPGYTAPGSNVGTSTTPGQYTGAYPQAWIDIYNQQSPETQAAMRARFSGKSPDQIAQDWNQNIQPQYPAGTGYQDILAGRGQNAPQTPPATPPPPTAGAPGSMQRALASGQTAAPQFDPATLAQRKSDEANFGAGSGTIWDPWNNPTDHMIDGQQVVPPGYAIGAPQIGQTVTGPNGASYTPPTRPGAITQWDNANGPPGSTPGPAPSHTVGGQTDLKSPLHRGGQTFQGGLQDLLTFMATSTPGQQKIKRQMEHLDAQGGSLEPGEGSLFTQFARYLGQNVSQPPQGATPFTDWDPVGLLTLLRKSGLFT